MLNDPQKEAVEHKDGPLLVLAGAGTGKTKVLTSRIAHIIANDFALPEQILAVTFTNKAAREMEDRINNIIQADGLFIGTFHSIATRMLRAHVELLNNGMSRNFTIINQDDQVKLIKNIAITQGVNIKEYAPKLIHSIISKWKDRGVVPDKVSNADVTNYVGRVSKEIYFKYQKQLQDSNVADFGDLLLYCNLILINNPDTLSYYQDKFKYILIDEYQDTNAVQYLWARMLASKHKNICCVGDDDQSIYSWRGAEVQNILRFERDFPNATIIKLEQNYRSSSCILNAASSVIKNNTTRHEKNLWTTREAEEKVKIITCSNDREEARFVGSKAQNYVTSGKYKVNQIAILVRAGFQTRAFEEVFISNALPYQIIGGLRFYERMEIRDVLAYIRLSVNKNDNMALERVINVPRRYIGDVTLKKIKDKADELNLSIFKTLEMMITDSELKGKTKESLQHFVDIINKASIKYETQPAYDVTKFILDETKYLELLKEEKTEESRARIENIYEMLRAIGESSNITDFIEHASLVMDNEVLESDFGGTIKIMTLHAAKGLEFDLVFLPGWEEGIFPHQKAIAEQGASGLEEERRIAYVGITRAKKELFIIHAQSRKVFAETQKSTPSRFLSEIPLEISEKISLVSQLNYMGSKHNFYFNNVPKTSTKTPISEKRPGIRVTHDKFGPGIIVKKFGDSLDIVFEKNGYKTIKEDYVRLGLGLKTEY